MNQHENELGAVDAYIVSIDVGGIPKLCKEKLTNTNQSASYLSFYHIF